MPDIDESKVNEAIRECLYRCEKAKDMLPEIAKFLDDLETRGGWSEDELYEVELGVIRMLFGILDSAEYPGEVMNPQEAALPPVTC
jgi:hypothetical protein